MIFQRTKWRPLQDGLSLTHCANNSQYWRNDERDDTWIWVCREDAKDVLKDKSNARDVQTNTLTGSFLDTWMMNQLTSLNNQNTVCHIIRFIHLMHVFLHLTSLEARFQKFFSITRSLTAWHHVFLKPKDKNAFAKSWNYPSCNLGWKNKLNVGITPNLYSHDPTLISIQPSKSPPRGRVAYHPPPPSCFSVFKFSLWVTTKTNFFFSLWV